MHYIHLLLHGNRLIKKIQALICSRFSYLIHLGYKGDLEFEKEPQDFFIYLFYSYRDAKSIIFQLLFYLFKI